jgi:hypothetical protein
MIACRLGHLYAREDRFRITAAARPQREARVAELHLCKAT